MRRRAAHRLTSLTSASSFTAGAPLASVIPLAALLAASGCSGFRTIERAEWVRVFADPSDRSSDAKQAIITKDAFEAESAAGANRRYESGYGVHPPNLLDTETIGLELGDVAEFLVDESRGARIEVSGNAVDAYLTPVHKRDEWKDGTDVTHVEASLFLVGRRVGSGVVRVVEPQQTRDIPLIVGR